MATVSNPTRRCIHCDSSDLEMAPGEDGLTIWWCAQCSYPNNQSQVEGLNDTFICPECSQDMDAHEDGTFTHAADLVAPKCRRHKAEKVRVRRAQLRLVPGGRA